jgi:hypothetical protein
MKCPIPKPASRIVTAAGPQRMIQCDDEATCTTLAPFTDKAGETHFQFVQTCLHHAISIACWKLTISVVEHMRPTDQMPRIQLI